MFHPWVHRCPYQVTIYQFLDTGLFTTYKSQVLWKVVDDENSRKKSIDTGKHHSNSRSLMGPITSSKGTPSIISVENVRSFDGLDGPYLRTRLMLLVICYIHTIRSCSKNILTLIEKLISSESIQFSCTSSCMHKYDVKVKQVTQLKETQISRKFENI